MEVAPMLDPACSRTLELHDKELQMMLKRFSLLLLPFAVAAILGSGAASATSAPGHASILIRHQVQGCHSWSVNGGAFNPHQSITLRRGGVISVLNADVMPHTLVLTSGPSLHIADARMGKMAASLKLTLVHPGTYHFTTKAGEDYMSGVVTSGPDNILRLTVVVK
jgi:plastocyanin